MYQPCGRPNRCFQSHQRDWITQQTKKISHGSFLSNISLPHPGLNSENFKRQKKQEREAWLAGSGSKACPVEYKGHQSEKQSTTPHSFVFSHERLFEVHSLGWKHTKHLFIPSPSPTYTHCLFTSLPPPISEKNRGREGGVAWGASRCPAPRD